MSMFNSLRNDFSCYAHLRLYFIAHFVLISLPALWTASHYATMNKKKKKKKKKSFKISWCVNYTPCIAMKQTSSNYDLRKLVRDSDSRAGSRPNSGLSRHSSKRPDSRSSDVNNSRTVLVNSNGNGVAHNNNNIPLAKTNGNVNHKITNNNNNEMFTPIVVSPNGQAKMNDDLVVGDVESLGGESQGDFGSQTQLLNVPANAQRDTDSGIHSAQGTTPVIPDTPPSDPSDSSDPKRRMSFLIDGMHHHHHHHHDAGETKGEIGGQEVRPKSSYVFFIPKCYISSNFLPRLGDHTTPTNQSCRCVVVSWRNNFWWKIGIILLSTNQCSSLFCRSNPYIQYYQLNSGKHSFFVP